MMEPWHFEHKNLAGGFIFFIYFHPYLGVLDFWALHVNDLHQGVANLPFNVWNQKACASGPLQCGRGFPGVGWKDDQ